MLDDVYKLQLLQSFGTSRFRGTSFPALDLPTRQTFRFQVLEQAMVEPTRQVRIYNKTVRSTN